MGIIQYSNCSFLYICNASNAEYNELQLYMEFLLFLESSNKLEIIHLILSTVHLIDAGGLTRWNADKVCKTKRKICTNFNER